MLPAWLRPVTGCRSPQTGGGLPATTSLLPSESAVWVRIGPDYLNLDNVASVHLERDDDGTLVATVELVTCTTRRFAGADAEALRGALPGLPPPGSAGATVPDVPA
jgi:hypothetical protein